ncbi:MAG: hypothetical protein K6D03_06250 [Solobacterium sp.]|nr:hypothetical protein [Solobacterium sp.]
MDDLIKQRLFAFRSSCRLYLNEKETAKQLEDKYPGIEKLSDQSLSVPHLESYGYKGDKELYIFLKQDIKFVEETFDRIEKTCGSSARVLMYSLYVLGMTQAAAAEENGISRRQLQYSLNKWIRAVFDD